MNSFAIKWTQWIHSKSSRRPLVLFRIAFASIWLVYDVIDLSTGQLVKNFLLLGIPIDPHFITNCQIAAIICEVGLLIGWKARWFAFGAFLARGIPSHFFSINDYLYFAIVTLILSQCDCEGPPNSTEKALAWPRDVLVLQTAWIYFASGLLKMNPSFLSGGDLYSRGNYVARVLPFYYPNFYLQWISNLNFDGFLAKAGVVAEVSLAIFLVAWQFSPKNRRFLRTIILGLVFSIHLYAAYAMNVFFFGASMIAQVMFLTMEN